MSKSYGWSGTVLNIDLTTDEIRKEPLSPDFARKYLGASGFNSARLFEMVGPEVDALSPENVVMFGAGPLSGTLAPGGARLTVTAKSPLTDIFGDANMGGSFAAELKLAGYDQIIISGKAKKPVYLWIDDDDVELRDASNLWGNSTWEAAKKIKEEVGDLDPKVIGIGQGGENLVRFANVISSPGRAAGRSGMGAVMGSKNLKAIAVRGSRGVAVARPREFAQLCREMRDNVINNSPSYKMDRRTGSPGLMELCAPQGACGVRNFQKNLMANWEAISGNTLVRDFSVTRRACTGCFVACGHFHSVKSGDFAGVYGEGPEFGLTGMGLWCEIDNMPALLQMCELFNQYGIDSQSGQQALGWAMECYERGILTRDDFDGKPLIFGDYNACIEWIPKIAKREGFGHILAEGEKRSPRMVGRGSEKYMYHIKGMGPIVRDPRTDKQFGLQFLTATRGADHLKGLNRAVFILKETDVGKKLWAEKGTLDKASPKGKGALVKWCEDTIAAVDAGGICVRACGSLQLLTQLLSAATGVDFTETELLQIGERIFNIQKAFNSRQGLTRDDDSFFGTDKFTRGPVTEGSFTGFVLEQDMMLDEYYRERGWDPKTGLQTRQKLVEVGLENVADELARVNAVK